METRLPAGIDTARFGTDKAQYKLGQPVTVTAKISDLNFSPINDAEVQAKISIAAEPDKPVTEKPLSVRLSYVADSSGHYQAVVKNLPAGKYVLRLESPAIIWPPDVTPSPDALETRFSVTEPENVEMMDLTPNWDLLSSIASTAGGSGGSTVMPLWNARLLLEEVPPSEWKQTNVSEKPLWNTWPMLVIFAVLVTVEWIIRKRVGLI
jgi:hypothetical protein